jgi:hypothetical protein
LPTLRQPPILFQGSTLTEITSNDTSWLQKRLPVTLSGSGEPGLSSWTYKQYFEGIRNVISREAFAPLQRAASQQLGGPVDLSDIKQIVIHTEKHGSLYHPARIQVLLVDKKASFVMNVALTETGRNILLNEFNVLQFLTRNQIPSFLPSVYFWDKATLEESQGKSRAAITMFLGDWFEGYFEFHPTVNPVNGKKNILVWDGKEPPTYLSQDETNQVYFQTAYILTYYYNPKTYEQIYPWHHAAGDFIVKVERSQVSLRMVTARQYGAMMEPGQISPKEALLFFFLNLSLRMPLDRLDGTGDIIWAEGGCLEMTWAGFIKALDLKGKGGLLGERVLTDFYAWLKGLSLFDLRERLEALLESYDPRAPDVPILKKNLDDQASGIKVLIEKHN